MISDADDVLYRRIYEVVREVPRGMVATYGDIAAIVGGACDARTVGYALNTLPRSSAGAVPWQRIVNREGGISTRGPRQRQLLAAEGVAFDARDRVVMARHRWPGPGAAWAAEHAANTLPPRGRDEDEGEGESQQLSLYRRAARP